MSQGSTRWRFLLSGWDAQGPSQGDEHERGAPYLDSGIGQGEHQPTLAEGLRDLGRHEKAGEHYGDQHQAHRQQVRVEVQLEVRDPLLAPGAGSQQTLLIGDANHLPQFSRGSHPRLGVFGWLRGQAAEDPDSLRSPQTHARWLGVLPELYVDIGVAEEDPHVGLHELRHENRRPPEVCLDRLQLPKPAAGVHDDRGVPVLAWDLGERRGVSVPRDEDVYVPSEEVAAHRWPPVCRQQTSDLLLLSPRRRDALPMTWRCQ